MSRTFRTVGSGASQTTEPIENNKIPVYETKAAAEADIANLSDGQIIGTKDGGNELSNPVDVVQDGNMHAVTSNAVADVLANAFKLGPVESCPIFTTNQTAPYDGFLFIRLGSSSAVLTNIYINDVQVASIKTESSDWKSIVIPICKGDTFRADTVANIGYDWTKARWYKNR